MRRAPVFDGDRTPACWHRVVPSRLKCGLVQKIARFVYLGVAVVFLRGVFNGIGGHFPALSPCRVRWLASVDEESLVAKDSYGGPCPPFARSTSCGYRTKRCGVSAGSRMFAVAMTLAWALISVGQGPTLLVVLHQVSEPSGILGRRCCEPALFENGQALEPILVRQRLASGLEDECAEQSNGLSHFRKPRPTSCAVILEPAQRIDRGARVQRIALAQQKVDPGFHRFSTRPRAPPVAYWNG